MFPVNAPLPDPPAAHVLALVGLGDVAQQIPLEVTADLPSEVTFPPPEALLEVMDDGVEVETVGTVAGRLGSTQLRITPPSPTAHASYWEAIATPLSLFAV
jgi:hypothetical protein